jgi:hypothetical protein
MYHWLPAHNNTAARCGSSREAHDASQASNASCAAPNSEAPGATATLAGPEIARLGITLRGLRQLRARLCADFAAGRILPPTTEAAADWPETVEGLRTEQVNTCWVEEVTKGSLKRLVEVEEYVVPENEFVSCGIPPPTLRAGACKGCLLGFLES